MTGIDEQKYQESGSEKVKTPTVEKQQKNLQQVDEKKANSVLASVVEKMNQTSTVDHDPLME